MDPSTPEPRRRRTGLLLVLFVLLAGVVWILWPKGPPGRLAAPSPSLDFGEVILGGEGERRELALTNAGARRLPPLAVQVLGEARAEFGVDAGQCGTRRLGGGEGCVVEITAWPLEEGPRVATLEVRSGEAEPLSVELSSRAATVELEPDRPTVRFGTLEVGETSRAQTILMRNRGSGTARRLRVELSGEAAGEFTWEVDSCSGSELPPGESCRLEVRVAPSVAGELEAELSLVGSGVEGGPSRLLATAEARAPLTLSPERLDFGDRTVGLEAEPRTVRVTNRTASGLSVRVPALPADSPFALVNDGCSRETLGSGASCSLSFAFRPQAEGTVGGSVELADPGHEGRSMLRLSGRGVIPALSFVADPVDFGDQPLGSGTARRTARLRNEGPGTARVEALRIVPRAGSRVGPEFSILKDDCGGGELGAGEECRVEVGFEPARAAAAAARLEVEMAVPPVSRSVGLRGRGVEARLQLDRDRVDLGQVPWGATVESSLLLANAGNVPLTLEAFVLDGPGAGEIVLGAGGSSCTAPGELPPAGSCSLELSFRSTRSGEREATLEIRQGGGRSTKRVPIRARVAEQPLPRASVSPSRIDFGEMQAGGRSGIETVTLSNSGGARLRLIGVSFDGPSASDFRPVAGSCEGLPYLAPGASCTIGMRFVPTTAGRRNARLLIRHDGDGGRTTVELTAVSIAVP